MRVITTKKYRPETNTFKDIADLFARLEVMEEVPCDASVTVETNQITHTPQVTLTWWKDDEV